jgi:stage III sporulation protein AA
MITARKRLPEAASAFGQAACFLPMFKDKLLALDPRVREKAREIRLRAGQAIAIESHSRQYINAPVTPEVLRNLIERFCDYSIHSYARQLAQGFITLEGGHRAGFCGTAVVEDDRVKAIRDITSINLRIAREFISCSDILFQSLPAESLKSLLIIGRPMSAKTTVLRDFARNLSVGGKKVTIIDERSEISAPGFDLGPNTDVLGGFPKKAGFITALRALSPDFIVCDEIADDGGQVAACLNSGAGVIMTAHCGGMDELSCSPSLAGIIKHIEYVALLGTGASIGRLQGLWRKDMKNENGFCSLLRNGGSDFRALPLGGA